MPNQEKLKQAEQDREEQEEHRKAAEEAGNIPQVSSAPLHNYPEAEYPKAEEKEEQKPDQPLSGAAATAKEH